MSLLTDVFLGPITLPTKGLIYVFKKIIEQAEDEFNDPTRVRAALINLQQQVDSGQLTLEHYEVAEAVLLRQLDAIEQRRAAAQQTTQSGIVTSQPVRRRRRR